MRWLRPDFQDPAQRQQQTEMLFNKERFTQQESALEHDLASKTDATATPAPTRTPATAQHWPNTLPEQIKAVAEVLAGATTPLTQSQIEAAFKGRGHWKKSLPPLLEALEALGRTQRSDDANGQALWR